MYVHFAKIDYAAADRRSYFAACDYRAACFKYRRDTKGLRDAKSAASDAGAEGICHVVSADIKGHKDAQKYRN